MVYHDVLWYGIVWYGMWGMATIFFSPLLPYSDPSRVTDSLPLPLAFLSAADTVVAHTPYCSSCKTAALASAASADFTLHNETLCAVHCMRFKLSECKAGQSRGIAQAAEADTCLIHQALSVRRLILEQEYSSVAQCGTSVARVLHQGWWEDEYWVSRVTVPNCFKTITSTLKWLNQLLWICFVFRSFKVLSSQYFLFGI